jgi:hypothetical protein
MANRIPIAVNLESRDGGVTRDAKAVNGVVEIKGQTKRLRKRPGCSDYGLVKTGLAQLLIYWNGIKTVIGDYFNSGIATTPTSYAAATWNPSDKGANITLSGGNLTASNTTGATNLVRSTIGVSSGQLFFECTKSTAFPSLVGVGYANATALVDQSNETNNYFYYSVSTIRTGSIAIATVSGSGAGDVIGVLIDATARTVSFYFNGVFQYTVTGANVPSGTLYPAINLGKVGGTNASAVANFGATAFAYTYSTITSVNLSPTTASLPFSAQDNGSNAGTDYLMFKNASQAWTLTPSGSPTLITDADYPGISTVSVTGITRSGTTATATTPTDTNFQVGSAVTIAGAVETDYNGVHTITAVTPSSYRPEVNIPITITRSGTTATATSTTQAHGFINGQVVPIKGANQAEYNGNKTITWISATQFSFTVTVTGTDISTPAGGSPIINPYSLTFQGTNTVGAPTVFACTYTRPEDQGSLTNGDTFTVNALAMGVCTVSGAGTGTFTLTSTGFGGASPGTFGLSGLVTSPTINSITCSSNIATVTTSAAHKYLSNKYITISGATPIVYNGPIFITVLSTTTFSYILPGIPASPISPATGIITAGDAAVITGASFAYAVANAPSSPATGTITASGGRNTVPGIAYINGYFVVMDVNGVIYNSAIDNPTSWGALDYTSADNEPGDGKCLAKSLNYIVAFKEWSTEFFYDAKNATGSPLSPVDNGFTLIGCATGYSVANLDGALVWVAQARQRGRSVYTMLGTQQTRVSTPDIERILNADDLATVYAYGLKVDGHPFYVLTLVTSNITLVYDPSSQHWYQWTSLTIQEPKSVTSITLVGTTATVVTSTAHGLVDGDPVKISGAVQTGYNGIWQIQYVDTTTFTIQVAAGLTTPATGTILAYPYTETYYKFTKYADCAGVDLMLHTTDGHLYNILPSLYQDAGVPINRTVRSQKLDGGTFKVKTMGRISLTTETAADTAMLRWSDDDYATNRPYRIIDLSAQKPMVRRCGAFVERSIEVKHIGNTAPVWDELEMEIQ